MRLRFGYAGLLFVIIFSSVGCGEVVEQKEWAGMDVKVNQTEGKWVIEGRQRQVTVDTNDLSMEIRHEGVTWKLSAADAKDLTVESGGKEFDLSLTAAEKKSITPYHTGFKSGVKIQLSNFSREGKALDLKVVLSVCLEARAEELICEFTAIEKTTAIKQCRWPKAFVPKSVDSTVMPHMYGMLIPRNWPEEIKLYSPNVYGWIYMPWYGHQKGKSAALVILETPNDSAIDLSHPAGGPTQVQVRWINSLGKLRYQRRARLIFFEKGNYVQLAKRYRKYAIEIGKFVSLKEKIIRTPILAKVVGSPVLHTDICQNVVPESYYYKKDEPEKNHYFTSFSQRERQIRALAEKGLDRLYIHLDGWGYRGYDNLHPDPLPPCPKAGGWDGLRSLSKTCDKLGFVFAIHDNYRDYYHDAKSYNEDMTIIEADGTRPFVHIWAGGNESILCPSFSLGHLKKNHLEMLRQGVKLRGSYLDVFAVVYPEECYSPQHPVSRTDCLRHRGECFDFIRANEGVVSSEEPADWAIPFIDLVHHTPLNLMVRPGPAKAIPVPLFSLVYHDALLVPWALESGWSVPENDSGFLYGLTNAGLPYISETPDEAELRRVKIMCELNKRVGLLEMTDFKFLDDNHRRTKSTFADGTTVVVDQSEKSFEIKPKLNLPEPEKKPAPKE